MDFQKKSPYFLVDATRVLPRSYISESYLKRSSFKTSHETEAVDAETPCDWIAAIRVK